MENEVDHDNNLGGIIIGPAACSFAGLLATVSIDKADSHIGHAIDIFAVSIPVSVFAYVLLVLAPASPVCHLLRLVSALTANAAWIISIFGIRSLFAHFSSASANSFLAIGMATYAIVLAIIVVPIVKNLNCRKPKPTECSAASTTPEAPQVESDMTS